MCNDSKEICHKVCYKFIVFVLLKPAAAFFNLLISVVVVVLRLRVVLPHNTILDATILPEKLMI